MGMFDEIIIHENLMPNREEASHIFQTKDLECCLFRYRINEIGELILNGEVIEHKGSLNFYTHLDDGTWGEYEAYFKNNRVFAIERF
jgi:hypothetical protein